MSSDFEKLPVEPEAQVMLFRIVQEAVQNALKHANATIINIIIRNKKPFIELTITDDGSGFNIDFKKKEKPWHKKYATSC